jgi:hypothetical protein
VPPKKDRKKSTAVYEPRDLSPADCPDETALATLDTSPRDNGMFSVSDEQKHLYLKVLAETGSKTKAAVAARPDVEAKIACGYFYKLTKKDPTFAAAERAIFVSLQAQLEVVAYDHAINGTEKPIYQGGEFVGTVVEHDHGLLQFLIKRNARILGDNSYEDKKTVEHTGTQTVEHTVNFRDLPREEQRRILAERQRIREAAGVIDTNAIERRDS